MMFIPYTNPPCQNWERWLFYLMCKNQHNHGKRNRGICSKQNNMITCYMITPENIWWKKSKWFTDREFRITGIKVLAKSTRTTHREFQQKIENIANRNHRAKEYSNWTRKKKVEWFNSGLDEVKKRSETQIQGSGMYPIKERQSTKIAYRVCEIPSIGPI